MSQTLQFGYFNLQGRGQIARLLLAYTKTQYSEVGYTFSKFQDWLNDKANLGLDFPSLPYLIDGKLKLTESKAIELYIIHRAKKASQMLGKNTKQQALINNIDGVLREVLNALIGLFFAQNFQAQRKRIYPSIEQKLNLLNKYVGKRNYFLNRVTYVDFLLTVTFSYLQLFYPHQFSKWENLRRVAQYINSLPQIVSYYKSPGAMSNLVATEKADDPKFSNIQPIQLIQNEQDKIEKKQQQSSVQQNIEHKESLMLKQVIVEHNQQIQIEKPLVLLQQEKTQQEQKPSIKQQNLISAQKQTTSNKKNQNQAPQQIRKTQSQVQQAPTVTDKVESAEQKNHFNTRVNQFQKAVQATNVVQYSQLKVKNEQIIVTPSKIGSSIKSNGTLQASWKILNENKPNIQQKSIKSSITLGYWGIRGLGQIQRHLLTYCGHDFNETIYKTREEWLNADKQSLNLSFPNLPYLIQGDFRLTESLAIDRYIIRTSDKVELLGKNLLDETLIENIVKILSQIFKQIRVFCFATEQTQQKKAKLQSRIDNDFKKMSDFIQNRQYALGYLTWADFYIAQISHYIDKIFPNIFLKYPFLKNIQHAINKLNDVQKYYEKDSSIKGPFMPPTAKVFF